MRRLIPFLPAALLLLLIANASRATSLETYGRLPDIQAVAVSPDGTQLALAQIVNGRPILVVRSLTEDKLIVKARLFQKTRRIEWADNEHLLLLSSFTGLPSPETDRRLVGLPGEVYLLRLIDTRTMTTAQIPQFRFFRYPPVVRGDYRVRRVGDHTELFIPLPSGDEDIAIFRVNLDTNARSLAWRGGGMGFDWVVDSTGNVAADETFDEGLQRWTLRARTNGGVMHDVVSGTGSVDTPRFGGYGPRADTVLVEQLQDRKPAWRLLSLEDGKLGVPVPDSVAFTSPVEDSYEARQIGFIREGRYVFFDEDMQQRWQGVQAAFPGQRLTLISHDSDLHKVVVQTVSLSEGPAYELVDTQTHQIHPLGQLYAGASAPLEVRHLDYPATDGLKMSADLTLPRNRVAKDLPLVVLFRGGPTQTDSSALEDDGPSAEASAFDWWAQALADQGYAVLSPNYGIETLTARFEEASNATGQRKLQTDLSDGVSYLAKQGVIDPKRVCIVGGGSYGGYAALAGVAFQSGIYRCAVSYAGIADLKSQLFYVHERIYRAYWDRDLGLDHPHNSALKGASPIDRADAITAPVLLVHGEGDTVVPISQSQDMEAAMHRARKDVQLVVLKREDHWLSHSQTRVQMLKASVAFLREHNPPE